jgi:uncharacterized membrane protein
MGLEENVAGLLCYALAWITGIIFLILEQENKFVRFHAMQSVIVFAALTVLSWIPFINWFVWVIALILWIVLMIKAYQGVIFKLPWIGDLAEKWTS